jgi:hypothetical protein
MMEFEAAEKELYELAAWLVNDAVRLKAHVAQCCAWARDSALAKAPPPGLLLPFPTHTLVREMGSLSEGAVVRCIYVACGGPLCSALLMSPRC